ncbi:DnaB-like helicase N-terminal domain-containing protein [Streptomyces sp. NPDC058579]|uniref:DnaB-like helicase N-terminal domain-containing protein n=1 Tax=Streptomyces sp. NPDC058579 TaxID=3346548 RepID=UPI00366029BF
MHPTPATDAEDLYEPTERPPLHYAEQALLGAVLLQPALLPAVEDICPSSFDSPVHAAVFAAMQEVSAPEVMATSAGLNWLTAVLAKARPQAPGLTPSYMHTLISACPQPQHVAAYAVVIRAEHARRTICLHAEQLAQAATDITVPDRPRHTLTAADTLATHLDHLAERFPSHARPLPRTPLPRTPLPPAPRPAERDEDREAEQWLLACAVSRPEQVQGMRWLTADDFLDPVHAGLWQAVTALTHRGDPVDPVTMLWEAQQRGLLATGIAPDDVIALLSEPVGSADYWGERLLERNLLTRALLAARQITAYTADPANTVHQLVTGSRRALADLHNVRSRWQTATRPLPASPSSAESTTSPRAGPRSPLTTQRAPVPTPARQPTAGRVP